MTDTVHPLSRGALPGLTARYRKEKFFKYLGLVAILFSLSFLAILIAGIGMKGYGAFLKTEVMIEITPELYDANKDSSFTLLRKATIANLPAVDGRRERRAAYGMIGEGSEELLAEMPPVTSTVQIWLPTSDLVDVAYKHDLAPEFTDILTDKQLVWLEGWIGEDRVRTRFNVGFLTNGDSRDPERAGIGGSFIGSIFTLLVCLLLSFGVGVAAAIYLEEFAPKNKMTTFLEVNINNLATVPSIIFGLLGLAVFLNVFGLPRSSSLVGGMVLSLMTLPTIIIASRVSLQAVPPSIREAALGVGASRVQMVFHHVLPLAMPGVLTGTILGMARALGETAPLIMIGMVAFIADVPGGFTEPATVLPVQVFLWSDSPERAFQEKTAGAIIVLLAFLLVMNLAAIIMRKKLEKKW